MPPAMAKRKATTSVQEKDEDSGDEYEDAALGNAFYLLMLAPGRTDMHTTILTRRTCSRSIFGTIPTSLTSLPSPTRTSISSNSSSSSSSCSSGQTRS
ncbi:Hypothetical protein NocV09_04900220 [Nannochloropsis oceanica]